MGNDAPVLVEDVALVARLVELAPEPSPVATLARYRAERIPSDRPEVHSAEQEVTTQPSAGLVGTRLIPVDALRAWLGVGLFGRVHLTLHPERSKPDRIILVRAGGHRLHGSGSGATSIA